MPTVVKGLDRDIKFIEDEVAGVVRDMARQTGEIIVGLSPVLTGFFVSNWNDSTGGPDTSVRGVRPDGETSRRFGDPTFSVQGTWDIQDGDIVFANAVEYAEILDGGGSGQAPQGVTEPASSVIDTRFRKVTI